MTSSAVAQQRKEDRTRVIDSVLDEQEEQWDDGYYDGDRLAAASQHLTFNAANLAATRAQSDASSSELLAYTLARVLSTPYFSTIAQPNSVVLRSQSMPSPRSLAEKIRPATP